MQNNKDNIEFLKKISSEDKPEMSSWQMDYLCSLIRERRPLKMLEVGVAAGGTTAVILNCLANEDIKCEYISTDIAESYYRNQELKTGYVAERAKKFLEKKLNHRLKIGILANLIDEIGGGIDFLILDTVHMLPGEILDFLVALPYLSEGATVVLHDVILHHFDARNRWGFATQVLLDVVVANKKNVFGVDNKYGYPNIAAFEINSDTKKYIYDVFSALTLSWQYLPSGEELRAYRNKYVQLRYNEECLKVYDCAVEMNQDTVNFQLNRKIDEYNIINRFVEKFRNKQVYIYGAGNIGKRIYSLLNGSAHVLGFVVSDGESITTEKTFYLSEVKNNLDKAQIVIAVNLEKQNVLVNILKNNYVKKYEIVDSDVCDILLNI